MAQQPSIGELATLIMSGDSHFKIVDGFLQSMPYETDEIVKYMPENWGMVFAAATNLALSIELYLKAIMISHNEEFEKTHDLYILFNELPDPVKVKIKEEYKAYNPYPNNPFDKRSAIDILHGAESPKIKKYDVESVLYRSKDSFVAYRYLFESIEKSSTRSIKFEYGALWSIARAIRKQLANVAYNKDGKQRVLASPFVKRIKVNKLRTAIHAEIAKR